MLKFLLVWALLLTTASVFAETGIYLNAETGWADQSGLPDAAAVGALKLETNHLPSAWSAAVGYNHDFTHLGVGFEMDGSLLGDSEYTFSSGNSTVKSTVMSFLAEITQRYSIVDVVVKGGLARVFAKATGINTHSEADNEPELVTGLMYPIGNHFAVIANYLHIFGDSLNSLQFSSIPRINAVMLGLQVNF